MLIPTLVVILSIVVLYFGAEFTLEASEKLGKKLGLSPLTIGMVIIGFGTSLPELFVGHIAGMQAKTAMAVGSLVGSNIANMFLILGVCALISPLWIRGQSVKEQLYVHLLLCLALGPIFWYGQIGIVSSLILLAVCGIYLYFVFLDIKREQEIRENQIETPEDFNPGPMVLKMIVGFSLLYLGGELLVWSGSSLGAQLGVSEYIISAIFLAFGTSFPELITALLTAIKGKDTDLIVGNILGSNVFNCSFILGSLGIYNFKLEGNFLVEFLALIFGAVLLIVFGKSQSRLFRFGGSLFITTYIVVVLNWIDVF